MKTRDVMTPAPVSADPTTSLTAAAQLMSRYDCGSIPVLEGDRPVGIVTDRDIVCRAVAEERDPSETTVMDVMSQPVVTVSDDDDLDTCCQTMADRQIRRVLVVDETGHCAGIIAQADLAPYLRDSSTGHITRQITSPA